jgi:hypothetical protein
LAVPPLLGVGDALLGDGDGDGLLGDGDGLLGEGETLLLGEIGVLLRTFSTEV